MQLRQPRSLTVALVGVAIIVGSFVLGAVLVRYGGRYGDGPNGAFWGTMLVVAGMFVGTPLALFGGLFTLVRLALAHFRKRANAE